jgi:hypothetical protein
MKLFSNFLELLHRRVQLAGEPYIAFGIYCLVNYMTYYFSSVWMLHTLKYEYLYRHIFDIALSILLLLKNRWPKYLVKYQPLFLYFCMFFMLPYSNILYFMQYPLGTDTIANSMLVLVIMILVMDWASLIIMLVLGIVVSYIVYRITAGPLSLPFSQINPSLYTFLWTVLTIVFLSRMIAVNRHNQKFEKSSMINANTFKRQKISRAIEAALLSYPFGPEKPGTKVHVDMTQDFYYHGDESLLNAAITNLLNNSFTAIKEANKGDIHIWLECDKKYNYLYFRDTAKGINEKLQAGLFDFCQYATPKVPGVGLVFCNLVMTSFGGSISVDSVMGEHAEFVLKFPYSGTLRNQRVFFRKAEQS